MLDRITFKQVIACTALVGFVSLASLVGANRRGWLAAAQPGGVQGTYVQDRGYFYRLTAKFTVKETGEALDFDYVVACNIRLTRWRDGGLSNDGSFGPRMMAMATAVGQAVALKTLNLCSGQTSAGGDVPPDLLPMPIWFDRVEDLSSGLAYVSEDAYENPLGKLTFGGARIDAATRADWEAWRKKAADAYVQRGALPGPWGYDYPDNLNINNPDIGRYVLECVGYRRIRLPAVIADKVRTLWPQDRPRFWTVPNEIESKIGNLLNDTSVPLPPGEAQWIKRFGSPGDAASAGSSGVPVRSGRSVNSPPHLAHRWPTENYPALWPPMTSAVPLTAEVPTSPRDIYVHKLDYREVVGQFEREAHLIPPRLGRVGRRAFAAGRVGRGRRPHP